MVTAGKPGGPYGNYMRPTAGGSGGSSGTVPAGSGGAAVKLEASVGFVLDGSIDVSGGDGTPRTGHAEYGSGGGAGGSVYIVAGSFRGQGSIAANGGNGANGWICECTAQCNQRNARRKLQKA